MQVDSIMTGHLNVPALEPDPNNGPRRFRHPNITSPATTAMDGRPSRSWNEHGTPKLNPADPWAGWPGSSTDWNCWSREWCHARGWRPEATPFGEAAEVGAIRRSRGRKP